MNVGGTTMIAALVAASSPSSSGELAQRLARLQTPVRVLYVAAHPDDENTQLLTWLARGRQVGAAYLSLTRGDGGQNLIGAEQRPLLGVIRTHELLAARALDGSSQLFTRLRDFGYSKSADETLGRWGAERALGEVVRALRSYRPHVLITRFPEEGSTHGHHLASARLARQAMAAAADPDRFPEQIEAGLEPWAPTRLFYNFPHFWAKRGQEPPPGRRFDVDVGGYTPWLGRSYGEISGLARSMHKSQGFGASARFGPWIETLVLLEGEVPKGDDPLAGLPTWADVPGAERFAQAVLEAQSEFDGAHPERSLPAMGRAHAALDAIEDPATRGALAGELERWMVDAAGLLADARAERAELPAGAATEVELRVLVRTDAGPVKLRRVMVPGAMVAPGVELERHRPWAAKAELRVPEGAPPTTPHWLEERPGPFVYEGPDATAVLPLGAPPLVATFEVELAGVEMAVRRPIRHHWVDPVHGERSAPLEVAPAVSITPESDVVLAPGGSARLGLVVRAEGSPWRGALSVAGPVKTRPGRAELELEAGESTRVELALEGAEAAELSFELLEGSVRKPAFARAVVDHPHIPVVVVRTPARVRFEPVELVRQPGAIGYVPGSGDRAPEILSRVGFEVSTLDGATLGSGDLSAYDAILVGVRAFNVNQALVEARDRLMAWVKAGGTLVVQYNTKNWSASLDVAIGPYPIEIGRGRVTDETAAVDVLAPEHPVLNVPHRIGPADFEGWVQERGLYFAASWDERYTPLFGMRDPGEPVQEGSTLVTSYGRGHYVFTGLSLFRQLPAGRPGALRLLVNMLSLRPEDAR